MTKSVINTKYFDILDGIGYEDKVFAYECAKLYYGHMNGITVLLDSDGLYYIVQSKVLR